MTARWGTRGECRPPAVLEAHSWQSTLLLILLLLILAAALGAGVAG